MRPAVKTTVEYVLVEALVKNKLKTAGKGLPPTIAKDAVLYDVPAEEVIRLYQDISRAIENGSVDQLNDKHAKIAERIVSFHRTQRLATYTALAAIAIIASLVVLYVAWLWREASG